MTLWSVAKPGFRLASSSAVEAPTLLRLNLIVAYGACVAALLVLQVLCFDKINPDGIAYARIAGYYAHGQWALAVTGYWGVLLSWIAVPFLVLSGNPVLAIRIAVGISALVFLWGGIGLLRAFRLPPMALALGAWTLAAAAAVWSTSFITPDLLAMGLLTRGTGLLIGRGRDGAPGPFPAGIVLGVGYLGKAVVLPVAVLVIPTVQVCAWLFGVERLPSVLRRVALAYAGLALVALPWIATLSLHYSHPTFSTSGTINHTIVGPPDVDRFHPTFRELRAPDPGRITSWEEPSRLGYARWSPFANPAYAIHQAKLVAGNVKAVIRTLMSFDVLGLGLAAAVFAAFGLRARGLDRQPWRMAALLLVPLTVVYLPVYAGDPRYFLGCVPIVVGSALGLAWVLTRAPSLPSSGARIARTAAAGVVVLSFLGAQANFLHSFLFKEDRDQLVSARAIAARIPATSHGIASVLDNANFGLYVAWAADKPYWGNRDADLDPASLEGIGADIVAVGADSRLAAALANNPNFVQIGATAPSISHPVVVYRRMDRPSG